MSSKPKLMNIGFNNAVMQSRIVAIVAPDAKPIKRMIKETQKLNKLIDVTSGRKTRTAIITDSDHIILSALQPQTLMKRIKER